MKKNFLKKNGTSYIPPFLRALPAVMKLVSSSLPRWYNWKNIEMASYMATAIGATALILLKAAKTAIKKGLEYLVISDHSQSAYYAKVTAGPHKSATCINWWIERKNWNLSRFSKKYRMYFKWRSLDYGDKLNFRPCNHLCSQQL